MKQPRGKRIFAQSGRYEYRHGRNLVLFWFHGRSILPSKKPASQFRLTINWVLRDESLHLKFGIQLIHTVLEENGELLTEEFAKEIRDIIIEGVSLEVNYNKDMFPKASWD